MADTELIQAGRGSGDGSIPVISPAGFDLAAQEYVGRRFEDSQEFSERTRDMALEMMRNLQNVDALPGLSNQDRDFQFSTPPSVSDLTVPEPPDNIQVPALKGEIPNIDDIEPPAAMNIPADISFDNDVANKLKEKFFEDLKSPSGYSPEVERAIYDRARSRREADLQAKKDQAASDLAKRGFPAPPGALHAIKRRYDVEDHREETDLNRDIIREQADLARQKYEFLMQTGVNLDQAFRERAVQQAQTVMEKARLQMQFALDVFSSRLRKAEAQSTIFQTEAQIRAEQARVESLRFEAYSSQIQGVQSKAELERIKAQIFSEKRQAETSKYSLQLEQDKLALDNAAYRQQHNRSIAEQAANIASQLAGSAMTAVSTSAQISGDQSYMQGVDYRMSLSRNDQVTHYYSGDLSNY
jgi:hypothetical protein